MLSQHSIVWEGLCASVPDGRGQRRVLQDAHGHALSGEPPSADAWVSGESEDDASDSESPLEGGILGILGPSGAGKTTLLRILAGHALPDAGRVLLDGAEYDGATAERIGYEEKLYGCLTASETLMLAARLRAVPAASRGQLVTDTLAALGLTSVAASQVGRLSGGERKRVSVATEMMHSPSLLLLDEPTSGLDANAARALLGSLRALCPRLAVALTIHQPGAKLWAQLSHCCLLAPGAQLYFGATAAAPSYFAKLGLPRPHDASVAEHLLDLAADAEPLGLPLRIAALGPATHRPPAAAARLLHASTARATAARRARAGR
ncbi:hypothetical protein EMIHUDRAFT_453981, partial [Emiliania huxleyi CCMP1516]|uniref:ABC transporter domain-containing protein n=2 Tax=Emiliania huxleyi TaxID=2903 RepID=A0A0D3HYL6_EMIH1